MTFLVHPDRPEDDPIFSLHQEAVGRAASGESIVNASIGVLLHDDGSLVILPTVAEQVKDVPAAEWASYAPIAGPSGYLQAVADDVWGPLGDARKQATAVATPGGSGALRIALTTFLERGQPVLTTSFYWSPYATLAEEAERALETFEMFPGTDATRLHVDALDQKLADLTSRHGRVLLLLNDPCHNPTGYSMSDDDWRRTAEVVARHASRAKITVLLDSAYCAYAEGGLSRPLTHLRGIATQAQILVAWSASKTFAQYGLRVGALVALVADDDQRRRTQAALSYACRGTWSNCNRGGMTAITQLLVEGERKQRVSGERKEMVALLAARVQSFNELARARGLRYPRYDGGFFVTMFCDDAFGACARLKAKGVFVVPQPGALRVALCAVRSSEIPRLVDALASEA